MRTIECSSGVKAQNVYTIEGGKEEERLIHSLLENRLEGEFFNFPFDAAIEILEKIASGEIPVPEYKGRKGMQHQTGIRFNLKDILKNRGVTQKELVEKTGIRQPTLSAWNMGKAQRINVEDMAKICAVLDCQPGDLFEYIPDEKTPQE